MARYCMIDSFTNVVINIIVWDGVTEYTPSEGTYLRPANDDVEVGWTFDGNTYSPA